MNILITGGSGFVASHLIKYLIKVSDYNLIVLSRKSINNRNSRVQNIVTKDYLADISNNNILKSVDIVIHLAAKVHSNNRADNNCYYEVNEKLTENLAKLSALSNVKKFLYLSTVKIHGEFSDYGRKISIEYPIKLEDDYSNSKFKGENKLIEISELFAMKYTIIRPTLVYGLGVKANFLSLINFIKKSPILPFLAFKNKRSFVSVENLVNLIYICTLDKKSDNKIFYISDGFDISVADLVKKILSITNKNKLLIYIPLSLLYFISIFFNKKNDLKKLSQTFIVDIEYTISTLGWKPISSLESSLRDMLIDQKII